MLRHDFCLDKVSYIVYNENNGGFMLKRIDYIDGLFEDKFIKEVSEKLHCCLFYYGHSSRPNPDENLFWISRMMSDGSPLSKDPDVSFIHKTIANHYKFETIPMDTDEWFTYLNGYTYQVDGTYHIDTQEVRDREVVESLYTIIYMPNYYRGTIQGFETKFGVVDFEPGRVVIFNSTMPHRGLSTNSKNDLRLTLTWKSHRLKFADDSSMRV